jgi:uncharacterized membrane protein
MQDSRWVSLIKGISWRFLATSLMILMSYIVIGDAKVALNIGLMDFVLKIGIFYLHDRAWSHVPYGLTSSSERVWRSVSKGITYRIIGSSISFAIGFFMTGSVYVAGTLAILDVIVKVIAYAIHEQLWQRVIHGRLLSGLVVKSA